LNQEIHVNDQVVWEQAVVAARNNYTSLPHCIAAELDDLIDDIMRLKQDLVEFVIAAGSADICRTCGGECCRYGKYHVSILDILAYLKNGVRPVIPDFSCNPYCPYSDVSGCTMAPCYRPMTCVVFNCLQVEDRLTAVQKETMRDREQKLRNVITRAGGLTDIRLDRALLLSCS
jgi:hypothetical protein